MAFVFSAFLASSLTGCSQFSAGYFLGLGRVHYQNREYDQAIQNFNAAIAISPNLLVAYNDRGLAFNAKGDHDRAILDFNFVLSRNPKHSLAFNNRGFTYYSEGDNDRAIQDYDQAILLRPPCSMAFHSPLPFVPCQRR